jgi:hypothetical protein
MAHDQLSRDGDALADGLGAWIADLRRRVTRGDLARLGPVVICDGATLPAELAARLALADLDHLDGLPPGRREHLDVPARRLLILHQLQALREQLG